MKKATFVLFLSIITISVSAQDIEMKRHNLGGAVGYITGSGFSYRLWHRKSGLQLTVAPIFYRKEDESRSYLSTGLTYLRILNEHRRVNFIGYFGSNIRYRRATERYWFWDEMIELPDGSYEDHSVTTGIGVGTDIRFPSIVLTIKGGYRITTKLNQKHVETLPSFDASIHYPF